MLNVTCPTFLQAAVHLCVVRDAHRYSAVVVESYEPYSPSGRNALCVVRDAHRYSAVVFESYVPYSPSGRDALCVVQDAHRYSAVVFESYVPYSPSGRNALCSARRPPLLCRHCCDSTHFCSQAKIRHRWCCCSKLRGRFHEDSRSVRHAEIDTQNLSRMS